MACTFELKFPPGMPVLSANDRLSWRKKAQITASLRMIGRAEASSRNFPKFTCVRIKVIYYPPDNRRRDTPNVAFATSKPLIDGIVEAGLLKDDSDRIVKSLELVPGDHVVRGGQIVIKIEEVC